MTDNSAQRQSLAPGALRGLSGKVLALTIVFVMLGEVLIFLPSIANFRIQWLKGRVAQAEIAALAAEAAPDQLLSNDLRSEILMGAGVLVVSLQKDGKRQLVLRSEGDHMIDASYDIRATPWMSLRWTSLRNLLPQRRAIRMCRQPIPRQASTSSGRPADSRGLRSPHYHSG